MKGKRLQVGERFVFCEQLQRVLVLLPFLTILPVAAEVVNRKRLQVLQLLQREQAVNVELLAEQIEVLETRHLRNEFLSLIHI